MCTENTPQPEYVTSVVSHPHLEEQYFVRMSNSLGDKIKVLSYLPPVTETVTPKVLDVGAGGGDFANFLTTLGYEVTALDISEEAINRIKKLYPHIETAQMFANEAELLGENVFDAVICSSVLHEVFSYGDKEHQIGDYNSVIDTIAGFHKILKTGGKLIIRDGVLPENWNSIGSVTLLDGHFNSSVNKFLEMCPFSNGSASGGCGELISLTNTEDKTFVGNIRSLMEFAYTYTWGLEVYPRETQELYGVFTLKQYVTVLENTGFIVNESFSYLQKGYSEHLKQKMVLQLEGQTNPEWFDSNAIWVSTKIVDK